MFRHKRILSTNPKIYHHSNNKYTISPIKHQLSQRDSKRTAEISKFLDIDFNIQVYIRIRTPQQNQIASNCIKVTSETNLIIEGTQKRQKSYQFKFDKIFPSNFSNQNLNGILCKQLIEGTLSGYNSSVFAYGSTGSGKTYTQNNILHKRMFGNSIQLGLVQQSIECLFLEIQKQIQYNDFVIKLVCVQLYNENLYDLISENLVELRQSPIRGTFLSGAVQKMVSSKIQAYGLIRKATAKRQTNASYSNETSSRSHAIIQIYLQRKQIGQGLIETVKYSKFSMIDLAGSEKLHLNRNNYQSKKINQSLLVLGNCIQQLYRNCQKGTKNHVPYRDSKLTRLLKDSLGGNTRTIMISTVSSSIINFDETLNTLIYSSHANKIKLKVKQNVKEINKNHMAQYQRIIEQLKQQNQKIKKKLLGQTNSLIKQEDYKKKLQKGFKQEMKIRKRLLQVDCKIQQMQFTQYRTYYNNSRSQKMYQRKPRKNQKQQIDNIQYKQLMKQKNQLTQKFTQTLEQRQDIMKQLTVGKAIGIENRNHQVVQFFAKKVLEIEIDHLNEQKQEKFGKKMEMEKRNLQMSTLIEQLKLREKIINKQRLILGQSKNKQKGRGWVSQFLDNLEIIPKDPIRFTKIDKSRKNVCHTEPSLKMENNSIITMNKYQQMNSNKKKNHFLHPSRSIQEIVPQQINIENLSRKIIYGRNQFKRPIK